jgi:zinc protease
MYKHKQAERFRQVKEKACRTFISWAALTLLVAFGHSIAWCETGSSPSTPLVTSFLANEAVDRTIPSLPQDLFVVLKNGMTVLVRESDASNVVSCQVLIKTGSIFEGDRLGGGLSHYLEHVVSGGTTSRYTEAEIKENIQAIGGATNAYTTYDRTVYFINTTGEKYRTALELLLAYVTDCQFDETEYQREKPVIVQEFQMGENNPSRQLWRSFVAAAYRQHPVRYPVIGQRDVFLGMDKNDLISHYRRWYTPENMVVAVVGHVDKEEVLKTILESAGALKRTKNPAYVLPSEPRQLAPQGVEKTMPTARLANAILGFRTVPLSDPDLYALDVLAVVMGDGRTSKLYRKLKDEMRLVLSIGAGSWTPHFVDGQFTVSMTFSPENQNEALDAVWDVIADVKKHSVSKEALSRAKNKVMADHIFGSETAEDQASQLVSDWVATGYPYFSDKYVERIRQVTREDIRRVARKYLNKEASTLAVVKPPAETSRKAADQTISKSDTQIQKRVLTNGMTILLKRVGTTPIVSLEFLAMGGLRYEPGDQPGLSNFMTGLLTKGTKRRSKLEIAKTLEDLGGSIGTRSGQNTIGISVSVLKQDFDTALDVLADVVLNPVFPENEIDKQRENIVLAIKRLDERWTTEISRLFKRQYYRNHPYGNDRLGTPESVNGFAQKDVKDFYERIMKANNAVLAVFGDMDIETAASKVQHAFKAFKPGIVEPPRIELETANVEEEKTFVTFNEKSSAAILVGYNGLTLDDPDVPAVDVLDAVISGIGYPSGWLHEALRGGEKSLVYFAHAYPAFGIDGGYFGVMTQTTPDNYDEVLEIILDRMALIQREEIGSDTLDRAKNVCITMHEIGLETIEAQASSAGLNEKVGLGFDYDKTYPSLVKQVSAADVLRVARRLFSHHLIVATKPKKEPDAN